VGLWSGIANDVPIFARRPVILQSARGAFLASLYCSIIFTIADRTAKSTDPITFALAESEYGAIYSGRTHVVRKWNGSRTVCSRRRSRQNPRQVGYSDDDFVLLLVRHLHAHRRLEDGINAIGQLASRGMQVKLLLAGSDRTYPEYLSSLKVLARNLGVQNQITFCGQSGGGRNSRLLFRVRRILVPERPANLGPRGT